MQKISLSRAARRALTPNAIIFGAATCLFGWSLAEFMLMGEQPSYLSQEYSANLFLTSTLLAAAASLLAKRALANLLAAALSGPLPLIQPFIFFTIPGHPAHSDVAFLSFSHFESWLEELAKTPVSIWLMTALSFAILCSAAAAAIRQTPARP